MTATLADIQRKAATDMEFRAALKRDPRATLVGEGIEVAEGVAVEVFEAPYNTISIVIPPSADGELDDELLAAVAGGAAQAVTFNTSSGTAVTS